MEAIVKATPTVLLILGIIILFAGYSAHTKIKALKIVQEASADTADPAPDNSFSLKGEKGAKFWSIVGMVLGGLVSATGVLLMVNTPKKALK